MTKIEEQDSKAVYTVDKGSADGVRAGVFLVGEKAEPEYENLLLVVSAGENVATLKSSRSIRWAPYQLGTILTTRSVKNAR